MQHTAIRLQRYLGQRYLGPALLRPTPLRPTCSTLQLKARCLQRASAAPPAHQTASRSLDSTRPVGQHRLRIRATSVVKSQNAKASWATKQRRRSAVLGISSVGNQQHWESAALAISSIRNQQRWQLAVLAISSAAPTSKSVAERLTTWWHRCCMLHVARCMCAACCICAAC